MIGEGSNVTLNIDSQAFDDLSKICKKRKHKVMTYGEKGGDLQLTNVLDYEKGQIFNFSAFGRKFETSVPFSGKFQIKNLLCAIGIAIAHGHNIEKIIEVIPKLESIKGRCQLIARHPNGAKIYLDYAHTPEALKEVLSNLRSKIMGGKLYILFGCGGDRDKSKRIVMGRIAAKFSDGAFITDDNPRNENPKKIRKQILAGF